MLTEPGHRLQTPKDIRIADICTNFETSAASDLSQTPAENVLLENCADMKVYEPSNRSQTTVDNMTLDVSAKVEAEESSNGSKIQSDGNIENVCADIEFNKQPTDEDDLHPFSLFDSIEESKIAMEKARRRDPVYDLFTSNDDENFVTCNREYCSTKLAVSSKSFHRFEPMLM